MRETEEDGSNYSKNFSVKVESLSLWKCLIKMQAVLHLLPNIIFVEGRDENTNVAVEVALTYNSGYAEHIYSYVNNINTIEGGTHVSGFRRALTRVFKSYGDKQGLFEKAKVEIEGDDFREGLSSYYFCKSAGASV